MPWSVINQKNINLEVTEEVKKYLLDNGIDLKYGARPLRRAIQRYVEDEISDMILRSEVVDGQTINVDFKNDKLTFDVKK